MKIIQLATTDEDFRRALKADLKEAINNKRKDFGLGYNELSEHSLEILRSLTQDTRD